MFTHLHAASAYSMHYGVSDPRTLVEAAAAQGAGALALTDRDGLYGAVKHVRACLEHRVAPILGADLEVRGHGRVTVLARTGGGYADLCRIVSAARAGILDRRLLATKEHLVVLVGPGSDVERALSSGDRSAARRALEGWRAIPELRVEVVCHLAEPGQPESVTGASRLLGLAEATGVGAVLTNAVRYAEPGQAAIADVGDAVARLTTLDAAELPLTAQAWLKTGAAMGQIARMIASAGAHPDFAARDLLAETERVAQMCALDPDTDLGLGRPHMPESAILGIGGTDPLQALWEKARAGLNHRYGHLSPAGFGVAEQRLAHEMGTVAQLGFAPYFLTVARVAEIIREMGIRVQARGSGVGSLLNYTLNTSGVDPLEHGLLWERFLSPQRSTLPDVDLDVESARRHDIYRRLFREFGKDRMSLMSMVSTYGSRGAVRDAGLALGMEPDQIDSIAKSFWRFSAARVREALAEKPELADLAAAVRASEQLDLMMTLTERLDGLPRHVSMHPCGVIISDAALLDRTPVEASGIGLPMSQFDKHDMNPMGLLKFDILGVRMQSAMAHALTEIERTTGQRIDLDAVPRDDPAVFDLLRSTHSLGVFQLESPGQMQLLGKLQPECFEDLTLEISLFRPGAMKNDMVSQYLLARSGDRQPDWIDGHLRPILEETKGVVVYHEQLMRILDLVTGCGLGRADEIRRGLADPQRLPGIELWVRELASRRGVPREVMDRLWPIIEGFGAFGFAKAHGSAFALPTYQSAWLKAHFPAHHLAGLLTHQPGMWGQDVIAAEARRLGIRLLPLDVQTSGRAWRVENDHAIRVALTELSGITDAERSRIEEAQPFSSLADFVDRARPRRPSLETLARIGALDAFIDHQPRRRHELLAHLRSLRARSHRPVVPPTQPALDIDVPTPEIPGAVVADLSGQTQTDLELQTLGLATAGHRMTRFHDLFRQLGVTPASRLLGLRTNSEVLVAGVRRSTNTPPVRSGRRTVFITLDDGTGLAHLVVFEDAQQEIGAKTFRTGYLLVHGRTQRAGARAVSVIVDNAWDLLEVASRTADMDQTATRTADMVPAVAPLGTGRERT